MTLTKTAVLYIFSALCLIVGSCPSMAAAPVAKLPAPPKSFSARFIETRTVSGFNQPLVSRGLVIFNRSHGFTWEVTAPYHYVFAMSASGVQEQLPDGSLRHLDQKQAPWLAVVRHIFTSALTSDTSELEHYFVVQVTTLKGGRRIELSPKPGPMAEAIRHISVFEAGTPQSLRIDELSGGRIDIRFLKTPTAAETP